MLKDKFKDLREKRQAYYNTSDFKFIDFNFDGQKRKVYNNANLSIFVDDYCNANCKFCVAQLRFENKGQMYKKCKIADDEIYFKRLDTVLGNLRPLNTSISLTGGEPTKSPRLVRIMEIIAKHGYRKRTITTNGSGLLDLVKSKPILQHIIDNGFQHLNISRTHYDEDINKNIMAYEKGYCSNIDLQKIAAMTKDSSLRIRMSCLLLKEGVRNVQEMVNYLDTYGAYGIDNIIFRELMDYDTKRMSNAVKMAYCVQNKVTLNDIWREIDKDPRFAPFHQVLGYYYYVELYKYKGIDMVSESADLAQLYKEKAKAPGTVFEMVFHPNGNLNGSWVDNEDILLPFLEVK